MRFCVPVKRVIDYRVHVQLKPDATGVLTNGVKHAMNPFDEIALEQALRLREQGIATEVHAVAVGDDASDETLRSALAMGADKAVRIVSNEPLQPFPLAQCFTAFVKRMDASCVLMGKQAIDDDCNQTGQLLAGLLGWSQGTFASEISFSEDCSSASVTREIDGGLETVLCQMPAVITADLRLCEPRLPSLPNIMKAKSKPIERLTFEELEVSIHNTLQVSNYRKPPLRQGGEVLPSFDALIEVLKSKGVLS